MISGALLSFGIALITLSLLSITSPISNTITVTKPYCIVVPPTAKVSAYIYENSTVATIYAKVIHCNESIVVKLPFALTLTPGKWVFEVYNESYPKVISKVVNETIEQGNKIIIIQKTVNYTEIVTTTNATYPFYVKLNIECMRILQYQELSRIVGVLLVISSGSLYVRKRILRRKEF